jgi:CDP-diacylglycerol--serine O-phosphatidyltransferase
VGSRVDKRQKARLRQLDLRRTLFILPNLITLASVFCGFNAMRMMAQDNPTIEEFYGAGVLLIVAMIFDLLDGRVARMTKTQSAFGLQLDSLADVISFGVAPALLVYKWVLYRYPVPGLLTAFLFVACGAIRLARFNVLSSEPTVRTKPSRYMLGLPIPPAAGTLVALVVANRALGGALADERYTVFLFGVTITLSLLMVSTIKFRSFKDLRLNTGTVLLVLFVVGSSYLVWALLKPGLVLIWLLSAYVAIALVETVREIAGRLVGHRSRHQSVPPSDEMH